MANPDKEFDEAMLPGLLAHEIEASMRFDASERADNRQQNLEYLRGEMNDVPARPNGSVYVSRDVNDTMAWMLPGLMRVFTASGRMVQYEPEEPGDEEYAEQATDYANYVFWKDNDGYRVLYDVSYDAMGVAGDGIVKHWWDDAPVTDMTWHTGVTLEEIQRLEEDEGVEVKSQKKGQTQTVMVPNEFGQPEPLELETYDIKVERVRRNGTLRVIAVEPENFLINEEARNIDEARFVAHRDPFKTRSDLIEMGFDRDKVENLPGDTTVNDTPESYARYEEWVAVGKAQAKSQERIDLYECYIKVDTDGDGIAETVRVYYAGHGGAGDVLEWEVWEDDAPFTQIPCYPRAHVFTSESVADRTKDVSRIKTVLLRQALDNLYASNLPMQEVDQNSVLNPDILTSPKFGGIIWKKPGSNDIRPHEVPFVADKAFAALDQMDAVIEKRTGVSRTMMALDPEALQNQTATASQNARDAAYSQTELVARNMAEGWRKVFRQILKLLVKHQDRPRMIRLRNEFVPMDPRVWNANMDCTINVGLGSGSRDRDMAMLNVILASQKELALQLAQAGFRSHAVEMLPKVVETLHDLAESAGIRDPERYFPEFKDGEVQQMAQAASQPQPDPQVMLEREKMAMTAQLEEKKLELDRQKEEWKAEGNAIKERAQLEADLQVKEAERQNAIIIAETDRQWEREKFTAEMAFKYAELEQKRMIEASKAEQMAAKAKQANGKEARA